MSGLRGAAERLAKSGRLPIPNLERQLLIEKVLLTLSDRDTGVLNDKEPWDDFLRRIGVIGT